MQSEDWKRTIKALDETDWKLLKLLQENNRMTIKDIAAQLNLSTTPIFERIRKLEKNGYILKNSAILNPRKLNLKLTAFIHLSISDHSKRAIDTLVKQITDFPEVVECHHITGQSDFLLKILLPNIEQYNDFVLNKISTVPNISNIETSFALSVRKNAYSLPI